jgi:hypothetical protein
VDEPDVCDEYDISELERRGRCEVSRSETTTTNARLIHVLDVVQKKMMYQKGSPNVQPFDKYKTALWFLTRRVSKDPDDSSLITRSPSCTSSLVNILRDVN